MERDIWQQAENAAAAVKERYGHRITGPWADYEWGMINGKLSALR